MIFYLIFIMWPFTSGVESVKCGPYSPNPYAFNCQILLTDKNPTHTHALTATLTDGMHIHEKFTGPLYYFRIPIPANTSVPAVALTSVRLDDKILWVITKPAKQPTTSGPIAPAPVGIPVPVP